MRRFVVMLVMMLAAVVAVAQQKRYKVGDLYEVAGRRGVVFEVSDDGHHGKIVSLEQSPDWIPWALKGVRNVQIGAVSATDGQANTACIFAQKDWQQNYPVAAWCASLGEGWYLPAIDELMVISAQRNAINITLKSVGAKPLYYYLWSSTESTKRLRDVWIADIYYPARYHRDRAGIDYARAVAQF